MKQEILKRNTYYLFFKKKIIGSDSIGPEPVLPLGYKTEQAKITPYLIFSECFQEKSKILLLWILFFLTNRSKLFQVFWISALNGKKVHQSLIIPYYFIFPFMGKRELQIGSLWTAPECRGKGLATYACHQILYNYTSSIYWFIVEENNIPSISVAKKNGFELESSGFKSRFRIYNIKRFEEKEKENQSQPLLLKICLSAGGAVNKWERAMKEILLSMRQLAPPGSQVLEIGYGDGLLSCYFCKELEWKIVGLDISHYAHRLAICHARQFGLSEKIEFLCYEPQEIHEHLGQYDAVFIKTVLYNSNNLSKYAQWLDWILSVLKPGGIFINFETGKASRGVQLYRRLRQREYKDLSLYTSKEEALYDERFEIIDRRYYGGWSQFFAPVPILYKAAYRIEEAIWPRNADNCFIVSIIVRKKDKV